jgi:hypothetical protein
MALVLSVFTRRLEIKISKREIPNGIAAPIILTAASPRLTLLKSAKYCSTSSENATVTSDRRTRYPAIEVFNNLR